MVTSGASKVSKSSAKIPVSKVDLGYNKNLDLQVPVSPTSYGSLEDEVNVLRTRNKVLVEALKGVNENANKEFKKNFDLVWYARNRNRYPNHDSSKRIQNSEEHREDLELLKTDDGDYHHGFHAGVLAAARMFKEQSDVLHEIEEKEETSLIADAAKLRKEAEESRKKFERRRSLPQVQPGEFPDH